ncbi:MAG: TetR/AcrR family transcriptional regulator [bacterium]|nr:TetR/AcrR family transcriptional regulator [bacterium]
MSRAKLAPRREPSQERSRQRVDIILDAVSELLVEQGFDAVTTRAIAEKAGVPVGSIYQFFPNKYAVLNALASRFLDRIQIPYAAIASLEGPRTQWADYLDAAVDALAGILFSDPSIPILWAGMQNSAELRASEQVHRQAGLESNMILLRQALPHVPEDRLYMIGNAMIWTLQAFLTFAIELEEPRRSEAVEELKRALKAYVRSYVAETD